MNENFNNRHDGEILGLKEFLDRRYRLLMEKVANSPVLPSEAIDIVPEPRAPFRPASFDANKNKKSPIRIRTTIDTKYSELFQEIEDLAQEYFGAAQKAFGLNNIYEARGFVDEAMQLLTKFELDVPEKFIVLNTEILSKFPAD